MARELKDGIRLSFYLEKKIVDDIKAFCERTGRTMTKVVEIALREYLENHNGEG